MPDKVNSEPDAFPGLGTAAAMLGIMGFVALCVGAVWLLYPSVRDIQRPAPAGFAPPGLELAPTRQFDAYLARQRALLAGAEGRMPIEDAMAAIVQRGTLGPGAAP